jgi:hypothetical protein
LVHEFGHLSLYESVVRQLEILSGQGALNESNIRSADGAQQNHWSECGRAASVRNSNALRRPHRSVLPFGFTVRKRMSQGIQQLKWYHYLFAAIAAYLMPMLVSFLHSATVLRSKYFDHQTLLYSFCDVSTWFWMCIPAGISFLALFPCLKHPILRLVVYGVLCIAWLGLVSFMCNVAVKA